MTDSHYVYAILAQGTSVPEGLIGLGRSPVLSVPYRQLSSATSLLDPDDLRSTTEDVLLHEAVVEALRQRGPALPVRFGTVLTSTEAVVQALAEQYDTLAADLARLGDKVELGLTVLWPERPGDGNVERAYQDTGTNGPGSRYLQTRVAEHRSERSLRERAEELADALDAVLRGYTLDHRRSVLPTSRIAVRAAYLLHPSAIDPFERIFEETRAAHPDLRFLLSGPWPPYSFVTVSESTQRAGTRSRQGTMGGIIAQRELT